MNKGRKRQEERNMVTWKKKENKAKATSKNKSY